MLAALSPHELAETDLTKGDVEDLFSTDNMEALRFVELRGEGTPQLKALMDEVIKGFPKMTRDEVMLGLEAVVGTPPGVKRLNLDYDRFLIVKKQQETIGAGKGNTATVLDDDMHPDFMASRGQLMCGKVLGDAFGIHEVFGALLNPTGGLVGPGNHLIDPMIPIPAGHLDPDNPIALHGVVHDAAGYLNTFHNDGPGYNYLDSSIEILGDDNPLSGQISGIGYWVAEAGDEYVVTRVEAAVVAVEKALSSVRDAVASGIDTMLGLFRSKKKETPVKSQDTRAAAPMETAEAIEDAAARSTASAAQARAPSASVLAPDMDPDAAKKVDAMSAFIWN